MFACDHRIMLDTTSSSRIGSRGSSSQVEEMPAPQINVVRFNENGQAIGPGSNKFASELGRLTRKHCPIYYVSWRLVPNHVKESLWRRLTEMFTVPDGCRKPVLGKASISWREYKAKLRKRHIDRYPTVNERRANCPNGIRLEDWERFLAIESTPDAIARRAKGRELRTSMRAPQTTGRRGAARTAEQLRLQDPSRPVTRTDMYIATHSRKDGSCPSQELSSQIKQIRAITSRDPSSTSRDIDHDPVAEVCGLDGKGRVRGMGAGVSRRALTDSAPARERLCEEQAMRLSVQEQLDYFKDQVAKELDILRAQIVVHGSQTSTSACTSFATPSSHLRSPLPASSLLVEQRCELLHPGFRMVGLGRVLRGGGDSSIPDGFLRIILDRVDDPHAFMLSPDVSSSSSILGDNVGEVVLWPTGFTRMLS